jgi:hypothetical protein
MWSLEALNSEPGDVDQQVSEILGKLTDDLGVWRKMSEKYRVDLFCGWFMTENNEGLSISSKTLLDLGKRGIELGIDIYDGS